MKESEYIVFVTLPTLMFVDRIASFAAQYVGKKDPTIRLNRCSYALKLHVEHVLYRMNLVSSSAHCDQVALTVTSHTSFDQKARDQILCPLQPRFNKFY